MRISICIILKYEIMKDSFTSSNKDNESRVQLLSDDDLDMVTGGMPIMLANGGGRTAQCPYCGKTFDHELKMEAHKLTCDKNPNRGGGDAGIIR